ncbi:MAG: hypothetical protein HKP61_21625 [Dactylosporangium sp.]|nr:DUF2637 domain-containing protein [Dactylosporangium sp.]NNJ63483.1 hypothetical protein [Dactylosporangium sp.]
MTNRTTCPVDTDLPGSTPLPTLASGVPIGDLRTIRHASRAEQQRLSADAEIERRARAARLELELREERRAAARREREANTAEQRTRVELRRVRRAAARTRLRAAAPRWAERALFVLPILFPMAVAWVGQMRFAMTIMGWPLPAAIVFAAGFELSTAYVARLDWLSRAAGDHALLFRVATWGFATGAAVMNYWHAADPHFAPTGEAVSYGLMSITGVVLWELLSTYRHRTALRADGKLPAARPRFGLARWIWFNPLTRLAWLLTLRDGYPTTDLAWRAAVDAVGMYGSTRAARRAVRAGRPVPRPEVPDIDQRESQGQRDDENAAADQRDAAIRDAKPGLVSRATALADHLDEERGAHDEPNGGVPETDRDPEDNRQGAVGGRMLSYARERLAEGVPVTGADLDRHFGTRDYGRKVLRRLSDESRSADRSTCLGVPVSGQNEPHVFGTGRCLRAN